MSPASDETCFNLDDVKKVVESKSADIINIKLMKCGGITKAIEILKYCREKKVPVMFGSMLEGPISVAAGVHVASAKADIITMLDLDAVSLLASHSVSTSIQFNESEIVLSEDVGLGASLGEISNL